MKGTPLPACQFERETKGVDSPGPVADQELLCRGVYENHIKTKKVRGPHWLRKTDLMKGELSVWRASHIGAPNDVAELLATKGVKPLVRVVAAEAAELRSLKLADGRRAICAVDDTRDGEDTVHKAHAALASCREFGIDDLESTELHQIYEAVLNLYEDKVIWSAAA